MGFHHVKKAAPPTQRMIASSLFYGGQYDDLRVMASPDIADNVQFDGRHPLEYRGNNDHPIAISSIASDEARVTADFAGPLEMGACEDVCYSSAGAIVLFVYEFKKTTIAGLIF